MKTDWETGWAIIQAIDGAHKKHTEETGCDCWQRALQADTSKFQQQLVEVTWRTLVDLGILR